MDIANVVSYDDAFDFTLKHPKTGEDTDIVFKLRSAENEDADKVELQKINSMRNAHLNGTSLKAEDDIDYVFSRLETCIVGWSDTLLKDGVKMEFTPENVKEIVRTKWIFKQLNPFVEKIENFMK